MTTLTRILEGGVEAFVDQPAPVIVGNLILEGHEVPGRISIGGKQKLTIHRLPGGVRFIDAMGSDDNALTWRGMFVGFGAGERARRLDSMRIDGLVRIFSFGDYVFKVVISHVEYSYQDKGAVIVYEVKAEIVGNLVELPAVDPFSDQVIADDCVTAAKLISVAEVTVPVIPQGGNDQALVFASIRNYVTTLPLMYLNIRSSVVGNVVDAQANDSKSPSQLTQAALETQSAIAAASNGGFDGSINGVSFLSSSDLTAAASQAGALAAFVQAGGYINRARLNQSESTGIRVLPIVHA